MSQPFPLDVQNKTCSRCLGMFAIPPRSNQVIWRPDFSEAGVTNGSESGFGQKAGSVTINSAVGVVCLPMLGHLSVFMSSRRASCTPSNVSNHPVRKRDVEWRESSEGKRDGNRGVKPPRPCQHSLLLTYFYTHVFLLFPDVSRCCW